MRLEYIGKRPPSEVIASCPKASCRIVAEGETTQGFQNRLYLGDNLALLGSLLDDPHVRGKVVLVYIDPPYSTNSVFESRTQRSAYHDLLGGSAFVEFLRERLILLREMLSEEGSIYVHLDGNMAFCIKLVLDEVFGANRFRNFITRKKCNPKNYTRRTYGNIADYILFYTKSDNYVWHRPLVAWSNESAKREYTYTEQETGRRFKKVPVHAPGVRYGETGKPWRRVLPPPGKHWQFPPSTLEEMDIRGEIYWSINGNPRRKIYLDNSDGIPVQDIWLDFRDAHNQNIEITGYPTEKNIAMLEQIVSASSDEGDIVLDCFAGSGTTLEAASRLGRKWIGMDSSTEAIETILRRFAHGTEPMGDFVRNKLPKSKQADWLPLFGENETEAKGSNIAHSPVSDFALYQAGGSCYAPQALGSLILRDDRIAPSPIVERASQVQARTVKAGTKRKRLSRKVVC